MTSTVGLEEPIQLDQLGSGVYFKVLELQDQENQNAQHRAKASATAKQFFTRRYNREPVLGEKLMNSQSDKGLKLMKEPKGESDSDKENVPLVTDDVQLLESYEVLAKDFLNVVPDGSVKKRVRRHGNGMKPTEYAKMYVHYAMFIEGNDEPFYATGIKPYSFYSYQENVMGWLDFCVSQMEVGEISYFLIDSKHGYGIPGIADLIPTNAVLLFEVELVKFFESPKSLKLSELPEEKLNEEPFSEVLKYIEYIKGGAKCFLDSSNYALALDKYKKGITVLERYMNLKNDDELKKKNEKLFECHLNAAACLLKTLDFADVLFSCNLCLQIAKQMNLSGDFKLTKVYFRMASAELELGHYKQAFDHIMLAKKEAPTNKEVVILLTKIQQQMKVEANRQKELEKKMARVFI